MKLIKTTSNDKAYNSNFSSMLRVYNFFTKTKI